MMMHESSWEPLVEKIQDKLGASFDPKRRAEYHRTLLQIFTRELPQFDKGLINDTLQRAYRGIRITLDWDRFICILARLLHGWWVKVKSNPGFDASTMLLLTDGTVMCQEQGGLNWKKLTPDSKGSYIDGTWSDLAPMHNTRRYYASAVLADGRVFVSGGEYSDAGSETNKTEIYDPVTDTWTVLSPPSGWTQVGDAACAVLPDGRVLLGSLNTTKTAIFDPATDSWTAGPTKGSSSSEESWVLLPDETVITVRCNSSRKADKYVAASNTWVDGGTLPVGVIEVSSSEIGAGILLPNGRTLFLGANSHTALYSAPAMASDPGTWVSGPDFPNDPSSRTVGCKDSPSCLMTNGKVLVSAGPVDGVRDNFLSPTYFYEFDGSALNRVADPPNATDVPYIGRMLLLPTGQILFAAQTNAVYAYTYLSCPDASWRPQITSYPAAVRALSTYTLHGRTLNGVSQAVGYGDDASAVTNYPLARIRHLATGRVTYCRTSDHSTMGVATGSSIESTNFLVPRGIPEGPSEICVVANGISSPCCPIDVQPFRLRWPFDEAMVAFLIGSLADGDLWVLGPNGPIPVDPWGPKVAGPAAEARRQIISAVKALQKLGKAVSVQRKKLADAAPLAPDDDTEQEEEDKQATARARRKKK